jgi:hypothetical protein
MLKDAPLQASCSGTHKFRKIYTKFILYMRKVFCQLLTVEPNSHSHPIYAFTIMHGQQHISLTNSYIMVNHACQPKIT